MSIASAALACAIVYFLVTRVDMLLSWQCLTRPIVVAPLIGLALGDFTTGVIMGASLEATFMGSSAIGGAVAADATTGSIIAVAYAIVAGGGATTESITTGLALAMTIGTLMAPINSLLQPVWLLLVPYWEKLAGQAEPKKFFWQNMVVYFITGLPSAVILYIAVAAGVTGLEAFIAACPAWVMTGFGAAGGMMTAVGFGILLSMIWDTKICVFYFVGFICAKSLGLSSLGIAVIGAAIALTIFFLKKDIVDAKNSVSTAASTSGPANSEEDFF